MDRDKIFDEFKCNLSTVEEFIHLNQKDKALSTINKLLAPLPQIADAELWNMTSTLINFIETDKNNEALTLINTIRAKVCSQKKVAI